MQMEEERWCVVTGGRGFAARHLVEMLLRSQKWFVRIVDMGSTIKLDPHEEVGLIGDALESGQAQYVPTDVRYYIQVVKVNVVGTRNVIEACLECKVKRLIYTSTPSVLFDGVHGIYNGNESMPYPKKHNDSYSATKAEAEALVIKANGRCGLLTCCIRPSSIFGPGDRLLVPSLVAAARAGKAKYIIGDGKNMYDFTYVENVAYGHICAERALASEAAEEAAGQAYLVTNMEPTKFWDFISLILEGLGYDRPRKKIPTFVMMPIAYLVEWTYKLLAPFGMKVPQLTPSRVRLLSCTRTFSCSMARKKLGYSPNVSLKDGLKKTLESFSHLKAEKQTRSIRPSKASVYLGGGKVAETLLWRDKKQTVWTILMLVAFYYLFFASGYTVITATSRLLLAVTLFLFIHCILPAKILGYKIEKVPASSFHFSEEKARQLALTIGSVWNSGVDILNSLSRGKDWSLFSKVVIPLLILKYLGSVALHTTVVIGVPFSFVAFYLYEKREAEFDDFFCNAYSFLVYLKADFFRKLLTVNQEAP